MQAAAWMSRWDRLLPELANRKVLKRLDGPLNRQTRFPRSPHHWHDLLTFRMGLGIIMATARHVPHPEGGRR